MNRAAQVKDHYQLVTSHDIVDVAEELLPGRITHQTASLLECNCPNHQSQSQRSLNIMADRQGWYCHGCRVGGDVLQLVEFIQSGVTTRGRRGTMPETHRKARDFLADKAGIPPLSHYKFAPKDLARAELARRQEDRCADVLTSLARLCHRHLLDRPEVLAWIQNQYSFQSDTLNRLQIGYAPPDEKDPIIPSLTGDPYRYSRDDLLQTGAFLPAGPGEAKPFFRGRILFPYWSRGRVVFLIGRKTPWTPETDYEQGKYKKLLVHDPQKRPRVAPCINNSVLYNEDCLNRNPTQVIITEGVTDCISLIEHGFDAISPVTVRIKKRDWERLIPKLRRGMRVTICQDNEMSLVGLDSAIETARALERHHITVRIVELPLGATQVDARQHLSERFGIEAKPGAPPVRDILKGLTDDERTEVERLIALAKVDVNDYFSNHQASDFQKLLLAAKTPLDVQISRLDPGGKGCRLSVLKPILEQMTHLDPIHHTGLLRKIREQLGKETVSMGDLRTQLNQVKKDLKTGERKAKLKKNLLPKAEPGTCLAAINACMKAMIDAQCIDETRVPEVAFEWFIRKGGQFFFTKDHKPFMVFNGTLYWMEASERGKKRRYLSFIYEHTRMTSTDGRGRRFLEILANLALKRGTLRNQLHWIHSDVAGCKVYFHLNNAQNEIVKLSPDGVEILKNGGNADGVVLSESDKILPIHYLPDVELSVADDYVQTMLYDHFTCAPRDRDFLLAWVSAFLLVDFAGTHPMTRFEGPQGSGKTMAAKLISTLIYGEKAQKVSTIAALYSDGTRNPMVVLDNLEGKNLTSELIDFLTVSATVGAKEKRKTGSDTETVVETPNCLVTTNGIEPLGDELSEIQSRLFPITFSADEANDSFYEPMVLATIKAHRNAILSALFKKTCLALAMIRDGTLETITRLMNETLGKHDKKRCQEYLSLMYLMSFCAGDSEQKKQAFSKLAPGFKDCILALNHRSKTTLKHSNPIVTALGILFRGYRQAVLADEKRHLHLGARSETDTFLQNYPLTFEGTDTIQCARSAELFVALNKVMWDAKIRFPMKTVQQFAQRFKNDHPTMKQAGFEIEIHQRRSRWQEYTIRQVDPPDLIEGKGIRAV